MSLKVAKFFLFYRVFKLMLSDLMLSNPKKTWFCMIFFIIRFPQISKMVTPGLMDRMYMERHLLLANGAQMSADAFQICKFKSKIRTASTSIRRRKTSQTTSARLTSTLVTSRWEICWVAKLRMRAQTETSSTPLLWRRWTINSLQDPFKPTGSATEFSVLLQE